MQNRLRQELEKLRCIRQLLRFLAVGNLLLLFRLYELWPVGPKVSSAQWKIQFKFFSIGRAPPQANFSARIAVRLLKILYANEWMKWKCFMVFMMPLNVTASMFHWILPLGMKAPRHRHTHTEHTFLETHFWLRSFWLFIVCRFSRMRVPTNDAATPAHLH